MLFTVMGRGQVRIVITCWEEEMTLREGEGYARWMREGEDDRG